MKNKYMIILLAMLFIPFPIEVVEILLALEIVFAVFILGFKTINKNLIAYPKLLSCFAFSSVPVNSYLTRTVMPAILSKSQKSVMLYLARNIFAKNYIISFIIAIIVLVVTLFILMKSTDNLLMITNEKLKFPNIEDSDYKKQLDFAFKILKGSSLTVIFFSFLNVICSLLIGIVNNGMTLKTALATYYPIVSLNIIAFSIPLLLIGISLSIEKSNKE